MAGYKPIALVVIVFGFSSISTYQISAPCDAPVIEPVNFYKHVEILVGYNRTFSCVIHSETQLKAKWTRNFGFPLPDHVISNTECPTLPNTTCNNLTLINVSQSDGSGYYTITAENKCGSDNFTVNVEIMNHLHYCLNDTELPPLLIPPPNITAVEGQTITFTSTYKGDYDIDELQAFWVIKIPNSGHLQYVFPSNDTLEGYSVTVQDSCPVTNLSCCQFSTSIILKTVAFNQSGTELESAGARPNDLTKYTPGYSSIYVYKVPKIIGIPGKECRDLAMGDSVQFSCLYNASSNPNITIAMWSMNGELISQNTSHYTLITEYGIDQLDQVRSTLIISNAVNDISGTYTCWCEYNKSMIYENELFRSSSASVCLRIGTGSKSPSMKLWELVLAGAGGGILILTIIVVVISLTCCCYRKHKRKGKYNRANCVIQDFDSERVPLLNGENVSPNPPLGRDKPMLNIAAVATDMESNGSDDDLNQVDPSFYNQQHRQRTDTLEIDGPAVSSQAPSGTTEPAGQSPVLPEKSDKLISGQTSNDFEEGLTPSHQKSLQQPGSHMVTGTGNFETVQEGEDKKGQQHHKEDDNGLSAPQQVVSTNPPSEPGNPTSTPPGKDGRTFVQEESSVSESPSATEIDDKATNNDEPVSTKRPALKHLSTSEAIDSEREAPISGKPAVMAPVNQESTDIVECLHNNEFGDTNKILNHIAVEFTTSINLDTLLPYLLQHQLLSDDEAYICKSQIIPPSQRAQELLRCLKFKGDKVILKLLCCLCKETSHIGHEDVAIKLMNQIRYQNFDCKLMCPTCNCLISDALDEMMDSICATFPPETWKELAGALKCDHQAMQQIGDLAEGTGRVQMLLQHWRKVSRKATKESLAANFCDANLDYELPK